jgi:hypothetical protein
MEAFASSVRSEDLRLPGWREPVFPEQDNERTASFLLVANAVNFSFWGSPKWTVSYKGSRYDGSFGLFAAFSRAVQEGIPLLDTQFLTHLSADQLAHILRGNVQIPLFQERLEILSEMGRIVEARFEGSFANVLKSAHGSAVDLVALLGSNFPTFHDIAIFDGQTVAFNKRAQLATAMLYARFGGKSFGDLSGIGSFTLFADYKLPQVLRHVGILNYDQSLGDKIDALCELTVEEGDYIRLATLCAGNDLLNLSRARFSRANALHLDSLLWLSTQSPGERMRPYHRTRSIFY